MLATPQSGGDFANGAATAAMAYAFNQVASSDDGDGYRQYDPSEENYHDRSMFLMACDGAQQLGCSADYIFESGLMYHPAPGFDGSAPIYNLAVREVPGFGDVRFHVFEVEFRIVNATMPGHKLHPGYVERQVKQIDQRIYIRTRGVGTGMAPRLNEHLMEYVWPPLDARTIRSLHGIHPPTRFPQ